MINVKGMLGERPETTEGVLFIVRLRGEKCTYLVHFIIYIRVRRHEAWAQGICKLGISSRQTCSSSAISTSVISAKS